MNHGDVGVTSYRVNTGHRGKCEQAACILATEDDLQYAIQK